MTDIVNPVNVEADETEDSESLTRKVAKLVVRSSVKFVIAGAITSIIPDPETRMHKVKVLVATYVIADMVAKNTGSYVDDKIEGWKQEIRDIRTEVKKIEEKLKADKEPSESPNP